MHRLGRGQAQATPLAPAEELGRRRARFPASPAVAPPVRRKAEREDAGSGFEPAAHVTTFWPRTVKPTGRGSGAQRLVQRGERQCEAQGELKVAEVIHGETLGFGQAQRLAPSRPPRYQDQSALAARPKAPEPGAALRA